VKDRTLVGTCESEGWANIIEGKSIEELRVIFEGIIFNLADLQKLERLAGPMLKISENPLPFQEFLMECHQKLAV